MNWIKPRLKHLLCAIPIGFVLSILGVLGCAFGMEFKDYQWSGKFDWYDVATVMIGGAIGLIFQIIILLLI